MDLKTYFDTTEGTGILSTADKDGQVDAAIYSRPHFIDGRLALIMRDRLSHRNLASNPRAVYLFMESGPGYRGKRLYITKTDELKNSDQILVLKRRKSRSPADEDLFLVFFEVTRERPLVDKGDTHDK